MNLLVTRGADFFDLDGFTEFGLLNEFMPRNIEAYAKNRKFCRFSQAVDECCLSAYYRKKGGRKTQRAALILVLWSFCLAFHRARNDKILAPLRNRTTFDNWTLDRVQVLNGMAFNFSTAHKTTDIVFKVEDTTFSRWSVQSCIEWLIDTAHLVKRRKGRRIRTDNQGFKDYEDSDFNRGLVYLDLKLFNDLFYKHVEQLVGDIIGSVTAPKIKPDIEFRHQIEVKESPQKIDEIIQKAKTKGTKIKLPKPRFKWVVCEDTPKYKRSLWKKNISYLKRYAQNLGDLTLSMGQYADLSEYQKGNVRNEWKNRKGQKVFDSHVYNSELLRSWFLISSTVSPTVPHAVYHKEGDSWLMGRIYGNKGIDGIKRECTPLLKINGEFAVSIDIKSSYVQTYVLAKTKEDPKQDFYVYEELPESEMNRDDMKLYTLIRLNAESELSTIKAYNQSRRRGAQTLSKEKLRKITAIMEKERPYLKELYGKPKVFKEIQRIESDFMIEVGKELLKRKIPYLHHCDAMYVKKSDKEETIKVFEEVATRMFGRKIYVGWTDNIRKGTNEESFKEKCLLPSAR